VSNPFPNDPEPGFVLHLCAALTRYFDITLLAPMGEGAALEEQLSGVRVKRYRYAPFRSWESLAYPGGIMPRLRHEPWRWLQVPFLIFGLLRAIRRLHSNEHYDLVHSHWLVPQGLCTLLALSKKQRPPLVLTSHGGDLHTLGITRLAPLLRWVLRHAEGLTTVSPILDQDARVLLGGDLKNSVVIPMGVDVATFEQAAKSALDEPHDGTQLKLLFVGRLVEKKGLRYLISALGKPELAQQNISLQIAGDGPLAGALRAQVRAARLGERVRFLGGVAYHEIPGLMATSDAVVVPSVEAADGDCDGLPTVILEAMAAKSLVIGTPVGGIRQVLHDGQTGCLVPAGDANALAQALVRLHGDTQHRRDMVANAFTLVQDYDWSKIAERYAVMMNRALKTDVSA
jgi:glycosyltransferase involved in cell wall biosynthesis